MFSGTGVSLVSFRVRTGPKPMNNIESDKAMLCPVVSHGRSPKEFLYSKYDFEEWRKNNLGKLFS